MSFDIVQLVCGVCGDMYLLQLEDRLKTVESLTAEGAPCCASVKFTAVGPGREVIHPLSQAAEEVWWLGEPRAVHGNN